MENAALAELLDRLASDDPQAAWGQFLEEYGPVILRVVALVERDADLRGDCFLYVAEQLAARQFARLRKFQPQGPASFSTWLRAVVRNLCLDWRRHKFGRQRAPAPIGRLTGLDQEVYSCLYEKGYSAEQTWQVLRLRYAGLTLDQVADVEHRVHSALTPRQRWALSSRASATVATEAVDPTGGSGAEDQAFQVPDPRPNPELLFLQNERRQDLVRALSGLDTGERLLLRLRYEKGLTLQEVARLTGLSSPFHADRRIRDILQRLREAME